MGATHFSGPVHSEAGFVGTTSAVAAGAGITAATGDALTVSINQIGNIVHTQLYVDVQGMHSATDDLDIIGVAGTDPAYLTQIQASLMGEVFQGAMTCLEAPTTGVTSIDLYSATEATGVEDAGIGTLAEVAVVTASAAWTVGKTQAFTSWPAAAKYLYLTTGAAGTVGTYATGKFMIEIWGYKA